MKGGSNWPPFPQEKLPSKILALLGLTDLEDLYFANQKKSEKEGSMELNFEGLEIQKWNIPMDRAQERDKKNGIICIVILFTPNFLVMNTSKMALFFLFSTDDSQKLVTVWAK